MKPYKETLAYQLETKKEDLEEKLTNLQAKFTNLQLEVESNLRDSQQVRVDIAFINDLLAQLSPSEPFDYMDSDVA